MVTETKHRQRSEGAAAGSDGSQGVPSCDQNTQKQERRQARRLPTSSFDVADAAHISDLQSHKIIDWCWEAPVFVAIRYSSRKGLIHSENTHQRGVSG